MKCKPASAGESGKKQKACTKTRACASFSHFYAQFRLIPHFNSSLKMMIVHTHTHTLAPHVFGHPVAPLFAILVLTHLPSILPFHSLLRLIPSPSHHHQCSRQHVSGWRILSPSVVTSSTLHQVRHGPHSSSLSAASLNCTNTLPRLLFGSTRYISWIITPSLLFRRPVHRPPQANALLKLIYKKAAPKMNLVG